MVTVSVQVVMMMNTMMVRTALLMELMFYEHEVDAGADHMMAFVVMMAMTMVMVMVMVVMSVIAMTG